MDLLDVSLAVLGFMAGLMLWSRLVYVSYGIYSAFRKVDLREQFKNPTDRQISASC